MFLSPKAEEKKFTYKSIKLKNKPLEAKEEPREKAENKICKNCLRFDKCTHSWKNSKTLKHCYDRIGSHDDLWKGT